MTSAWGNPPPQQPYGPPGNPYGQPPYGQPPYGQPPYGQPPWGRAPGGQPGYPGSPYGSPGGTGFGPSNTVPYYGAPPPMPQPRRRNPLGSVLLGMIVLAVLAVAGLAYANSVSSPAQAAYQNEDYKVPPPDKNPPPLPAPTTYSQAENWLTANKLYNQSVPVPVRCQSSPVNVSTASDATLESHFNGLMECLVRVWQPPVTAAGFVIVRPSVTIYGREISTKCGKADVNAFYCSADQQVYFSNLLPKAVPIVAQDKWAADVVMAHEFGHAIQGRTGLLISAHALAQNTDSKSEQNQFLRRLETQADCFSGQFIRATEQSFGIQQSDLAGIQQTFVAVGDDTLTGEANVDGNHGLAASRKYWGTTGLSNSTISSCNTFTAPARLVR